jgi:uncharacterized protein (TIGR02646 family)
MKMCQTLAADPPGLADFRAAHPTESDWAAFRNWWQDAYSELAGSLEGRQRGLCAFCETRLITDVPTPARQVEHWRPKSNGGHPTHAITFGIANLHASCLGGSKPHLPPPFGTFGLVPDDQLSCGQKKGDEDPETITLAERPYRPTELPIAPIAFTVDIDGFLAASPDGVAAGLSAGRLAATISFLGLNCERLRISRSRIRTYLDEQLVLYEAEEADPDPAKAIRSALMRLASDLSVKPGEPLPPFISVLRDYFGPVYEAALLPDPNWAAG